MLQKAKTRKILKTLGFFKDQKGIINRYLREQGGWNSHLENCRKQIINSAEKKDKNTAMILGSGWCLDVPLEELSHMFNKVVLVDILHPRQIKYKIKRLRNIELVQADIAGSLLEATFNYSKTIEGAIPFRSFLLSIHPFSLIEELKPDFVVSVNLLNQLDSLASDFLISKEMASTGEIKMLKELVQKQHLEILPQGKTCLITDYEELVYSKDDELVEKNNLIFAPFDKQAKHDEWTWEFDNKMYYRNNLKTKMKVMALEI